MKCSRCDKLTDNKFYQYGSGARINDKFFLCHECCVDWGYYSGKIEDFIKSGKPYLDSLLKAGDIVTFPPGTTVEKVTGVSLTYPEIRARVTVTIDTTTYTFEADSVEAVIRLKTAWSKVANTPGD